MYVMQTWWTFASLSSETDEELATRHVEAAEFG
jgi:hypothetical protein